MHLSVRDNGIGLPAGFDVRATTSFGSQLVLTLTEQLNGQLEIASGPGTHVAVSFPAAHVPLEVAV